MRRRGASTAALAALAALAAIAAPMAATPSAMAADIPHYTNDEQDVPAEYRMFVLDTTETPIENVRFDEDEWTHTTAEDNNAWWPTKPDAGLTVPDVGEWTDGSDVRHTIDMRLELDEWNGGNVSELGRFDEDGRIVRDGLFWINNAYDNAKVPKATLDALGRIDTSRRAGCRWTVTLLMADTGAPVPADFKGVTGFNDLDGWDADPDLAFEGVELVSGFDAAYTTPDAQLQQFGENGFAGVIADAGDESNLDGAQQSRHRVAATWTGPTFTFGYSIQQPQGRLDGSRMTFGAPITRLETLTYKLNGGQGAIPNQQEGTNQ